MSENNTTDTTGGDATSETSQPSSGPQYRVHGSIRLHVTVTATNPDEATQAVPAALTNIFAAMPATVIAPGGLAIGIPTPLPRLAGQPSRYQVPVTVHGHLDLNEDEWDLPYTALHTVANYLNGRDDVSADLDSAVCDHVSDILDEQPTE
jgi:hypothetical protein